MRAKYLVQEEKLRALAMRAQKLEALTAEVVARVQEIRETLEEEMDNPREVKAPPIPDSLWSVAKNIHDSADAS